MVRDLGVMCRRRTRGARRRRIASGDAGGGRGCDAATSGLVLERQAHAQAQIALAVVAGRLRDEPEGAGVGDVVAGVGQVGVVERVERLEAELPKLEPQADDKSAALEQLDGALKQLEATRAQLEKSAGEGNAEAIKQAIEGLEATKKQLEDAKAKLAE